MYHTPLASALRNGFKELVLGFGIILFQFIVGALLIIGGIFFAVGIVTFLFTSVNTMMTTILHALRPSRNAKATLMRGIGDSFQNTGSSLTIAGMAYIVSQILLIIGTGPMLLLGQQLNMTDLLRSTLLHQAHLYVDLSLIIDSTSLPLAVELWWVAWLTLLIGVGFILAGSRFQAQLAPNKYLKNPLF